MLTMKYWAILEQYMFSTFFSFHLGQINPQRELAWIHKHTLGKHSFGFSDILCASHMTVLSSILSRFLLSLLLWDWYFSINSTM